MIPELVQELGAGFTQDQYVFWSRIQGSLWTLADIVIVFYLTRIANLARAYLRAPRRVAPYVLLAMTLPPAALIPFVETGRAFFLLEIAVTVPHFLVILWIVLRDAGIVVDALRLRSTVGQLGSAPHPR